MDTDKLDYIFSVTKMALQQAFTLVREHCHDHTSDGTVDFLYATTKALHEFYFEYAQTMAKMSNQSTVHIDICEDEMRAELKLVMERFVRNSVKKNAADN